MYRILMIFAVFVDQIALAKGDFHLLASKYIEEYLENCNNRAKNIWKIDLCPPMIIVDKNSNQAVASKFDPLKKFSKNNQVTIGEYYGPNIYANTSILWNDERWSMVLWPLPDKQNDRVELLMHEAFHSVQHHLNLPSKDALLLHLDEYRGRKSIRLEWEALYAAIVDSDHRSFHLKNAIRYRHERFQLFSDAQRVERDLDLNEGLAAFNGFLYINFNNKEEKFSYLRNVINTFSNNPSMTRSSSYVTGVLVGELLMQSKSEFVSKLPKVSDVGEILSELFQVDRVVVPHTFKSNYDIENIEKYEKDRQALKDQKQKKYLSSMNENEGFVLQATPNKMYSFDPNKILMLSENDVFYDTYGTEDEWGRLEVSQGVRSIWKSKDRIYILSQPTQVKHNILSGNGWTLHLNKGWKAKKERNGKWMIAKQ